ncbi:MAG TPA: hypothetical protein VLN49_23105 [Gemmatimonadaceae bacterium]|nr:hypothetical protein [Gemmatimonadaceae bacterium]
MPLKTMPRRAVHASLIAVIVSLSTRTTSAQQSRDVHPSDYLYLWSAAADSVSPDFLAVFDVREAPGRYGKLVTTVPVPGRANGPHHTEHVLAADDQFFVNGFHSGQSFIFDLRAPAAPRIVKQFGDVRGFMHPHAFWRLPNGNVLATFQMQHQGSTVLPGGIAEITPDGTVLRTSSAYEPGVHPAIRPYSAAIVPSLDRIVTTTSDMDGRDSTRFLQLWRLSDFKLLRTFALPDGPRGDEALRTAEPRVLADGKTVLVSTFNCGLYLLEGIGTDAPKGRLVASFPRKPGVNCAVPVVSGHYYIITVPSSNAVVSLDISNPAMPREVSRITLGPDDVPHWIGIEPNQRRVVITGYRSLKTRVLLANFDSSTGKLTLDERFRAEGSSEPGFRMEHIAWPHGGTYDAIPHGAVFSRPRP